MILYVYMFGARIVYEIYCKFYVSLIVTRDGCRSYLHVSHIYQKLPKQTVSFVQWLVIMYFVSIVNKCNGDCSCISTKWLQREYETRTLW